MSSYSTIPSPFGAIERYALSTVVGGCLVAALFLQVSPKSEHTSPKPAPEPSESESIDVVYFYSPNCPDCAEIRETVLPILSELGLEVVKVDVTLNENLKRILETQRNYGVEFKVLAPNMVFDGRVLVGPDAIRQEFFGQG